MTSTLRADTIGLSKVAPVRVILDERTELEVNLLKQYNVLFVVFLHEFLGLAGRPVGHEVVFEVSIRDVLLVAQIEILGQVPERVRLKLELTPRHLKGVDTLVRRGRRNFLFDEEAVSHLVIKAVSVVGNHNVGLIEKVTEPDDERVVVKLVPVQVVNLVLPVPFPREGHDFLVPQGLDDLELIFVAVTLYNVA